MMFCEPPMSAMNAGEEFSALGRQDDQRQHPAEGGEHADRPGAADELVDLAPARRDDVAGDVRVEHQAGHDGEDPPDAVVHARLVVEIRVRPQRRALPRVHETHERQPHHAGTDEDQPRPPAPPPADQRGEPQRHHVGRRDVAAQQRHPDEDPAPPPVAPQVAPRQQDEQRGQRLGVVVVGRGPVRPRVEHEHRAHATRPPRWRSAGSARGAAGARATTGRRRAPPRPARRPARSTGRWRAATPSTGARAAT